MRNDTLLRICRRAVWKAIPTTGMAFLRTGSKHITLCDIQNESFLTWFCSSGNHFCGAVLMIPFSSKNIFLKSSSDKSLISFCSAARTWICSCLNSLRAVSDISMLSMYRLISIFLSWLEGEKKMLSLSWDIRFSICRCLKSRSSWSILVCKSAL